MKSWLRGMTAVAAGLMAGTAAQTQAQGPGPGPAEPAQHPLQPAGYVDPPSDLPTFSDLFPPRQPLQPGGGGVPTNRPVQYEAEPDINGLPKIYHEPDPCPLFPTLNRLIFGDAILDRAFFGAGYTVWNLRSGSIPFAVATTSISGAGQGALNDPDTAVLLGNRKLDFGSYTGPSLDAGAWFTGTDIGIESNYFSLGKRTITGSVNSNQYPILSRPFFDTTIGSENISTVSSGGFFGNGSVAFSSSSQMWGIDLVGVARLSSTANGFTDLLVGGKYLRLQEDLYISSTSTADPVNGITNFGGQSLLGPNTVVVVDGTKTTVQFFGGTVGTRVGYTIGQFTATGTAKITLGETQNTIVGLGSSTLNPGPGQSTLPGGLLVVGLNNTRREDDKLAFMPEGGLNLAWAPIRWLSLNVGYDFAYLTRVARPGDQFDRNVNPTLIPTSSTFTVPFGPANPTPKVSTSDMWMSSFTFGVTLRF